MKLFNLCINSFAAGVSLGMALVLTLVGAPIEILVLDYAAFCFNSYLAHKLYGVINEQTKTNS